MKFKLDSGDTYITLSIDEKALTKEMATECNNFWSGSQDVLRASSGDVYEAVARRAAGRLIQNLLEGFNERGAVQELLDSEGWPNTGSMCIRVLDYAIPELDPCHFVTREVYP
jgi:hypothetical protein